MVDGWMMNVIIKMNKDEDEIENKDDIAPCFLS